jgi:hypothetical protein
VIPEGVTEIGERAFNQCKSLENVVIPSSVTYIKEGAFYGCENLKSVTLSEGIAKIGDSSFRFCPSLESIVIPGSVTNIGYCAFAECRNLETVTMSEGTAEIRGEGLRYLFKSFRQEQVDYMFQPEDRIPLTCIFCGPEAEGVVTAFLHASGRKLQFIKDPHKVRFVINCTISSTEVGSYVGSRGWGGAAKRWTRHISVYDIKAQQEIGSFMVTVNPSPVISRRFETINGHTLVTENGDDNDLIDTLNKAVRASGLVEKMLSAQ